MPILAVAIFVVICIVFIIIIDRFIIIVFIIWPHPWSGDAVFVTLVIGYPMLQLREGRSTFSSMQHWSADGQRYTLVVCDGQTMVNVTRWSFVTKAIGQPMVSVTHWSFATKAPWRAARVLDGCVVWVLALHVSLSSSFMVIRVIMFMIMIMTMTSITIMTITIMIIIIISTNIMITVVIIRILRIIIPGKT